MKNDDTRIWRLGLPDDWEPDDLWCVSFQIPAGDQYVEALSAVLGLLTISKTWERDETHTGAATVAKTWQRALMFNPMTVNENCNPVQTPPIPDAAAAADAAAAYWNQFLIPMVTQINSCASVAADCSGCVDTVMAELAPYGASSAVRGAIMKLCEDLTELSPAERAAYETQCLYKDDFEQVAEDIENSPFDWLNQFSDWILDLIDSTSDNILYDLNVVGGLLGGSALYGWIGDHGGIPEGGGASFGGDCEWVAILDMTVDPSGWAAIETYGPVVGVWQSGDGFITEEQNDAEFQGYYVTQRVGFVSGQDVHYKYLKVTYDLTPGTCDSGYSCQEWGVWTGTGIHPTNMQSGPTCSGCSDGFFEWTGDTTTSTLRYTLTVSGRAASYGGGEAIVKTIEVHGVGYNPWP